jgi:predicted RNA-binding Zn-ribbon protein involved in translation (DUF1610 family)
MIRERGVEDVVDLERIALELYDRGFNVIPVGCDKRPLCKWSSRSRVERKTLVELLKKACGVALVAGPVNPWYPVAVLVVVDIDNPDLLIEGSSLKSLVDSTVAWYTGPRCPRCGEKHLEVVERGVRFKCPNCGVEFTASEAKRGVVATFTVDLDVAEKHFKGTIRTRGVEFLVNNYALIPPSRHPTGVIYEWIRPFKLEEPNLGVRALVESEVESLLGELGLLRARSTESEALAGKAPREGLRKLSDSDMLRVKELLREAYRPGSRQFIWLFLSGWAAKAGVDPISVAKILKMLYEETGDTDPLKTRASAVVYSYKKAGIDLTLYASEFEELFGVKPYGLEREINEEEVKGKAGLQEVLEEALGEERALEVIREIEEVFRVSSPFRDSVAEILDYEKQLYALANLRKLIVVRARREGEKLVYREKVAIGAPVEVVVYVNPIGGVTKYRVKWEAPTRPRPIILGPALLEEIIGRLKAEGLIVNSRLASDVITAIIDAFIRRGRAEVKTELEAPGFYLLEEPGQIVAVGYSVEEPSVDELRDALTFLNKLAVEWFSRVIDRFSTAMKWWILAPFSYVIKQMGTYIPALYQQGPPNTRKTTINMIGSSIWGFKYPEVTSKDGEIPGSAIDTTARLEYWLNRGTFPVCIKEPGAIFEDPHLRDMIKSAIESTMARGKYRGAAYITTPALAPLSFTSNTYIPRDPAFAGKRVYLLKYTVADVLNPERREDRELIEKFESTVIPQLSRLRPIGGLVACRIIENPEILRETTHTGHKWLDVAEKLLAEVYNKAGLTPPDWIKLRFMTESITEIYEDVLESIRSFLVKRINEEYNKFVGRVIVVEDTREQSYARRELELEERVKIVLDKKLIPWLIKRRGEIYITTGLIQELEEKKIAENIRDLKSLAELLGWNYGKESFRVGGKVRSNYVVIANLQDFLEFLSPKTEEPTTKNPNTEKLVEDNK